MAKRKKTNDALMAARDNKSDEFYTQYDDVAREVEAYLDYDPDTFRDKTVLLPCDDPERSNFTRYFVRRFDALGLKKLVSTSIAAHGETRGRIFTLSRGETPPAAPRWGYLDGDGDFRGAEASRLRDEADMIVTNPPFSLFREFVAWIMAAGKKFLIIGNQNALTYKEFFPYIQSNRVWLGVSITGGDRAFNVPDAYPLEALTCGVDEQGRKFIRVKGVRWFTNLEHGRRHQPLPLMTMAENRRSSPHKLIRERGYPRYDNYDAVEVSYTDAIPSDCGETMGVPITFLDKYCPEQFEIVGLDRYTVPKEKLIGGRVAIGGKPCYARILIRKKTGG